MRSLVHHVHQSLAVAFANYKRSYISLVRPVNEALQVGDSVDLDTHENKEKLDKSVAGPDQSLKRHANAFSILADGYSEEFRGDHVTRAPTPCGNPDTASIMPRPQARVMLLV